MADAPGLVLAFHGAPAVVPFGAHPSVVAGVGALAVLYWAVARWTETRPSSAERLAFSAGLAAIVLALDGPLDAWADARLFTAHMLQHLVLTLVVPPLLLLGVPAPMLRPLLRVPGMRPVARLVTHPVIAFAGYNAVLVVLHLPAVFERMVRDQPIHIALHLLLLAVGVILWWPLASPLPELPRLSYPGQMLYLFLLLTPMAAVAAPITLAPTVLYPWYAEGPRPWGIAAHADQVIGGLAMWIGAGFYLLCVFSLVFFRWARHEDRDTPAIGASRLAVAGPRAG
jgi:putative membrane protein